MTFPGALRLGPGFQLTTCTWQGEALVRGGLLPCDKSGVWQVEERLKAKFGDWIEERTGTDQGMAVTIRE